MKKFWFLVAYGIKKRLKSKGFVIATSILGVAVLVLTLLPAFLSNVNIDEVVVVIDNKSSIEPATNAVISLLGDGFLYQQQDIDEGNFYENEGYDQDFYLVISGDSIETLTINMYYTVNDSTNMSYIISKLSYLRMYLSLPDDGNNTNVVNVETNENITPNDVEENAQKMAIATVLALPVFLLVVLGFQLLGSEIVEEKQSKAIEIILSSVSPSQHYYSKIISVSTFMIIQACILLVIGIIGGFITSLFMSNASSGVGLEIFDVLSSSISNIWGGILYFLLFTIMGVLFEMTIGALIAGLSTSQEDYSNSQAPVMIINVLVFYLAIYGELMQLFSQHSWICYLPLISAYTTPYAVATGIFAWWQGLISLFIMVLTIFLMNKLINPIYKNAILSYDSGNIFKRIRRYIKRKPKKAN